MTTSNELLPCPCCGGKPMEMQYDGILWVQCEDCALNTAACDASADYVQLWNRRATQPAAGEPVHQVEFRGLDGGGWHDVDRETMELRKAEPKHWHVRTLYSAPPAAAHGDEAVRKPCWADEHEAFKKWARSRITPLKLDLDEVGHFYDEVAGVAHDAWHARAAMRAQGDGD